MSTHIGSCRAADRPLGRFSEGLEQLPEARSTLRVGRFSEGIERLHADVPQTGRFSEGMERSGEAAWKLHAGSFAEGFADARRAPRHRGLHRRPADRRYAAGADHR